MSEFILSAFADEIDANLKVQMDILEKYGIRYIEMRTINGRNLAEHSLNEVKDIKKHLDDRGFKVSAIGSPIGKINITDPFVPHFELFKHIVEIAKILETGYIRMFSFYTPEGDDPWAYRQKVIDRWVEFVKAAEGTGLTLLNENDVGLYGCSAERCLDLYKKMNRSSVKMTFDPGNFILSGTHDCLEAFEILKDYVVYVHAKDALIKEQCFVPSGKGDARMKEIIASLHKSGFKGFISIEPHLNNNAPGGGPKLFETAYNSLKKLLAEATGMEI